MTIRHWVGAVLAAALLAGCTFAPPYREPEATASPSIHESTPTPENVEERVRAVLARTGGDTFTEIRINTYSVDVVAIRNDRLYRYSEDDRDPTSLMGFEAQGELTLDDVDLAAIMTETVEVDASCTEPNWTIASIAYDLWTTMLTCDSGGRYRFWPDNHLVETFSMVSPQAGLATASRLPSAAPAEVYEMVASSNGQNGELLEVTYADPKIGSVELRLSDDPDRPITSWALLPRALHTFPLSAAPVDKIVECGEQQLPDAADGSWFVNIRYSPRHGQVVMKWDLVGGWDSVGPLTDMDCQTLGA